MGSKDAPQKMQFVGAIKKVVSLGTFIQNAKWSRWKTAQIWLSPNKGKTKVPAFQTFHPCGKKPENNRSRVPIHFATNRFTCEKFPSPPPLLHPTGTIEYQFPYKKTQKIQ